MKRLTAKTPQTTIFNINTKKEINKIHEEDNRCTYDNLIYYEKSNDEGVSGGIYYELKNGKVSLYIVEAFFFHDVEKSSSNEVDIMAYVATKLDKNGHPNTNEQIVFIDNNGTKEDEINQNTLTINSHGLQKLKARNYNEALSEIKQEYSDFSKDMIK